MRQKIFVNMIPLSVAPNAEVKREPYLTNPDFHDLQTDEASHRFTAVKEDPESDLEMDHAPIHVEAPNLDHIETHSKAVREVMPNKEIHTQIEPSLCKTDLKEQVPKPSQDQLKDAGETKSTAAGSNILEHLKVFENMAFDSIQHFAMSGDHKHFVALLRYFIGMQDENGDNALHLAVLHDKKKALTDMLEICCATNTMVALNQCNDRQQTPLHIATRTRNSEFVELLLRFGADPLCIDDNGNSSFHIAAKHCDLASLRQLCHYYRAHKLPAASLNVMNFNAYTPLLEAIVNNNEDGVNELLQFGASVDVGDGTSGQTPLQHAVQQRNIVIASSLIFANSNVNKQRFDGSTALHLAVEGNMTSMVRMLMKANADPFIPNCHPVDDDDEEGYTCTSYDYAKDNVELLRILDGESIEEVPIQDSLSILSSDAKLSIAKKLETQSSDWKRLAKELGLEHAISYIENDSQPCIVTLLNYFEEHRGTLTELSKCLEKIGREDCIRDINKARKRHGFTKHGTKSTVGPESSAKQKTHPQLNPAVLSHHKYKPAADSEIETIESGFDEIVRI